MTTDVQQPGMPETPDAAIEMMAARLSLVRCEQVSLSDATHRVLAQPIYADRPSPPCDVSAMDGYAVRLSLPRDVGVTIAGEVLPGQAPQPMPATGVLRIFTGAPLPKNCEAVVPREEVDERQDSIVVAAGLELRRGQYIRRSGENGKTGELIVDAGVSIGPTVAASLANFGAETVSVYRRVRVGVIVTGNEIESGDSPLEPWQLRDSNGPTLKTLLGHLPWMDWQGIAHARDNRDALRQVVAESLTRNDALLLTGGVSVGDYDFVPETLTQLNCETLFHKLPIRPGKPLLGAIGPEGQAVLALPGNPVSVMTLGRRIVVPILCRLAGFQVPNRPDAAVTLVNAECKQIPLRWSRPVRLLTHDRAELVFSRGSGDLVSAARSDGFVEIPPCETGPGPWPFYRWSLLHC
jgi:molybdopterin molybdotransferase